MPLPVPDGIYCIKLPHSDSCISDPGQNHYLHLVPRDEDGDAHKIEVQYKAERNGYVFRFEKSQKFLTWEDVPSKNTKLVPGDKPRYFTIKPHSDEKDFFAIGIVESKEFHVGMAKERIFPAWVALSDSDAVQPWRFEGVY
ncbi:hypothetical protein RhiLY_09449 [Ceratobasidium sp. AG-Ba]|nr:hypothetical protein RhiLY_09449 [Ceratobasidium sp. AG-Ba]